MAFSLAKNGVSHLNLIAECLSQFAQERLVPELVAATGSRHLGGLTLFQASDPLAL